MKVLLKTMLVCLASASTVLPSIDPIEIHVLPVGFAERGVSEGFCLSCVASPPR